MKKTIPYIIPLVLFLFFIVTGCTEQYVLQTNTFESAIVVEATLTNELKQQQIKITRTYRLEESGPTIESGAEVNVTDDNGIVYHFEEENGVYLSTTAFEAKPGTVYRLSIITSDGKSYSSSAEKLTTVNPMQSVVPTIQYKNGAKGVGIVINSFDPTATSQFYRYEYEETYKIIAPEWDDERAILAPFVPGERQGILVIPREGETRTCYTTKNSDDIIQTTTNSQGEDRVNYAVRFISSKDPIITHRYSILVRQYVQNLAAYTFYKTLKELSGSESILSQNQPGFFYGNVRSTDNPNEKVVGFFEVASVSSQRIFFNFTDLFPQDPLPPYFTDCKVKEYLYCFDQQFNPNCKGAALNSIVASGSMVYVDSDFQQTIFFMVAPPCGDCTRISSNIKPSFWID